MEQTKTKYPPPQKKNKPKPNPQPNQKPPTKQNNKTMAITDLMELLMHNVYLEI